MDVSVGFLYFLVTLYLCTFESDAGTSEEKLDGKFGRIKEFDSVIMMHTKNVAKQTNLDKVRQGLTLEKKNVRNVDDSLVDYYFQVIDGLEDEGDAFINNERDRFNVIMSNAQVNRYGDQEVEFALKRRNILEAFVDAIAEDLMAEMNFGDDILTNIGGGDKFIEKDRKKSKKSSKKYKHDL